ncbi:hypothetical protein J4N45_19955 [Vibrio sp. SCSIO 43140]|uniref:hypothetical protein n=1 Tax=Vibrio sp. SCSIO 43140 TaxID=2819100 RepID=UPI00207568F4|nr:hypothetical protein [Vibrio sp. SCSIO 43140]USD63268.1 hypothetical protein J4N45_19955 [Vibrio sp. SCSIO 43140]
MKKLTQCVLAACLISMSSFSFANNDDVTYGAYVGEKEVVIRDYVSTKVKTCLYKGSTEMPLELKWGKALECPEHIKIDGKSIHEGDGLNTSGYIRI